MTFSTILIIFLLVQLLLLGALLWLRYLGNKDLFKTQPLQPVRSKVFPFKFCSSLFDLLDRIPFLRRSGTANEFDLLKAMLIVVVPTFALEILLHGPSVAVILISINILLLLINTVVLAHPLLKRLSGVRR